MFVQDGDKYVQTSQDLTQNRLLHSTSVYGSITEKTLERGLLSLMLEALWLWIISRSH
jgi:hypothetical protein